MRKATGINEIEHSDVFVYPNPVIDQLTVKHAEEIQQVRIYDMNGRLVKSVRDVTNGAIVIEMSDLQSGTYVVRIVSASKISNCKILKQ